MVTKKNIENSVARFLGMSNDIFEDNLTLDQLNLDLLDIVELLMEIEISVWPNCFGNDPYEIPSPWKDGEFDPYTKINKIVDFITNYINSVE